MEDKGAHYTRDIQRLCGVSIMHVTYCELASGEQAAESNHRSLPFDVISFGIEWTTNTGRIFSIVWDDRIAQYGLAIREGPMSVFFLEYDQRNVTADRRWSAVTNVSIEAVKVYWSQSWPVQQGGMLLCPHTLEIMFASGRRILLVAAKYFEDQDMLFPMADSVVAIFDDEVALRYNVGPFDGSNQRITQLMRALAERI